MGTCLAKPKAVASQQFIVELKRRRSLEEFPVDPKLKDALPTRIKSRLSNAIILSYLGRSKVVIKVCLVISRSSRAYVIT